MEKAVLRVENFILEYSNSWSPSTPFAHFHPTYEIYYLISGEVDYFIDNELHHVNVGDIVLIPPNVIHKTIKKKNIERKRLLIFIAEEDIREYLELYPDLLKFFNTHLIKAKNSSSQEAKKIQNLFAELIEENASKNPNYALIKALIVQLVITFGRVSLNNQKTNPSEFNDIPHEHIQKITDYLLQNFNQDISLETLSHNFNLHQNYISRIFSKYVGLSYYEYLTSIRMKNAVDLLVNTDYTITQIAEKCGFKSCNIFCVNFKKVMGVTPLQYRKIKH